MELLMVNLIYVALLMREQTGKSTFSCKDDLCKTLHLYWSGAKDLFIDEAHMVLGIFLVFFPCMLPTPLYGIFSSRNENFDEWCHLINQINLILNNIHVTKQTWRHNGGEPQSCVTLHCVVLPCVELRCFVLSKKLKSSIFDKESATKHYHRKIIKDLVAINIIASQPPEQRPTALQCGLLVLKWWK